MTAKRIRLGELRHQIELINVTRVDDGAGGSMRADVVEAVVDGAINPASWSQMQRAEQLQQRVSHTITIRWRPDLAAGFGPEARARFTDAAGRLRELSVKTVVDPDERARWLELGCLEGGPL